MQTNGKHPILVVDDETPVLYSLRGLLRKEFSFQAAESGYAALQILETQPIHVVMADQRMPGMTGVDFLAHVRRQFPDVVRLIFTGYADLKAVVDAINRGHVFRYITKPWDPDDLQSVLRQACARYEQTVESKRLLHDLQSYVALCLARIEEPPVEVSESAGATPREQLVNIGKALVDRLNRVLVPGPSV